MTISEIGRRMSCHELTVSWPAFLAFKDREQKREADRQKRL